MLNSGPNSIASVQDALGNSGASLRITAGGGKTALTVTGTATGTHSPTPTRMSQPPDTIALSPQAQAYLSKAGVALTLISDAAAGAKGENTAAAGAAGKRAAGTTPDDSAALSQTINAIAAATSSVQSQAAGQSGTDAANSSGSSADTTAQTAAYDPNAYYATLSNPNELDAVMSIMGSDEEKSSFLAAFNSRTLNIQPTSTVPGLDLSIPTFVTASGVTRLPGTYNGKAEQAAADRGGGYSLLVLSAGNDQFISWGPKTASTT